jgi:hypothetical protein
MKCVLCNQRKAKRFCPAKNALICAQCCGEKRVLEIDCPESCPYLKAGRERDAEDYTRRLRNLDATAQERNKRVFQDHREVVAHLEYALSRERLLSRDLTDKDVAQAVDVLLETYRTEDKGVLYEKTSNDLRVESLRRELRKIVESFRNPEGEQSRGIVDPKSTRLPLGAAIDCLEFIRSMVGAYMEGPRAVTGYVDLLARLIPREEKRSSLIMS